jgi:hypothetical protein
VPVTESLQDNVYVYTVTTTVTEDVIQTDVVTSIQIVDETDQNTDFVTQTDTANVSEATSSSGDAGIADVNTDVVTVTDVETSTFLVTTTVTSDASTSTSDVGGNIADVTTSSTDTSTVCLF